MNTNIKTIAKSFGSARKLATAIGVSHTLISVWNRTGDVPPKYNDRVRSAADELVLARVNGGEWGDDDVAVFRAQMENCLADNVCRTCGRML